MDTRCAGCGAVYVASPNSTTVVVTWDDVGYYNQQNNLTNNFQLVLKDQSVVGNPSTTGTFNTTNVAGGPAGLWTFAIRAGAVPGTTADNPLLPVTTEAGWNFNFNVILQNQQIFIDPAIAVGYDYIVTSGPNFRSVLLPVGIGDNLFDLWLWNGTDWVFSNQITGGVEYFFASGDVDRFRILGIETNAGLNPNDTLAFTTGLTFEGTGAINVTQTAIVTNVDTNAVPEPSALLLMLTGLAGVMGLRGRRRKADAQLTFRMTSKAYVPAGAGIKIGKHKPLQAPISSCDNKVCEVRAWLTPELKQQMSSEKLLIFAYFIDAKRQVSLPVSLQGFPAALERLNKLQAPARP